MKEINLKNQLRPLYDALLEYKVKNYSSFHMPGHMGKSLFAESFNQNSTAFDLTELPELDNLYEADSVIDEAQRLTAKAFGADRSFFLVNGSTVGILTMIGSTLKSRDKLILPRNCHKSVISAITLMDINPVYINNEYSREHSFVLPITATQVKKAFEENPEAKAILILNPDYYGACGDLQEIEKIVHRLGKLLLVDEAHGAHFPFHSALPPSAGKVDADMWIQSAHKTLPAFTQSAYLHIRTKNVNPENVLKMLSFFQTSSPSYLLMASLDWARSFMVEKGNIRLQNLMNSIEIETDRIKRNWEVDTISDYGKRNFISFLDSTRVVIDFSRMNINAYEALSQIRKFKIEPEMADFDRLVFIVSVMHEPQDVENLFNGVNLLLRSNSFNKSSKVSIVLRRSLPKQIISPKQAFDSIIENIPLTSSSGRICAQTIGAYPPGISLINPGELIDREGLEELICIKNCGGKLFGMTPNGNVNVVK